MSSSVFFKFKSQQEMSRVTFDGTGISVFELKRQIITINRLGDGTDFDLAINHQETGEEYDDDTTIIPRSTPIIARRLPPSKPGRGTAQRYVSGKMPMNALPNAGRREKNFGNAPAPVKKVEPAANNGSGSFPGLSSAGDSEEDKIAAMFQASSEQWNKTQEHMANATPIHRGGGGPGFKKNNAPAPAHPPPNGYICYRCGEKGHWIQQCPTNADPNFDGRPRVKRTTGIPRSFLKTVEKPLPPSADDDSINPHSNPTSVMVNADGEYVVAQPDQASWESYQKKAATTTKASSPVGNKELQDRGIECLMCHKLLRDASKTPCCGKVYCEECIQSALLESDFVCPNCEAKDILLGSLVVDTEARSKVEQYLKEKEVKDREKSMSPSVTPGLSAKVRDGPSLAAANGKSPLSSAVSSVSSSSVSRKRPAEDDLGPQVPRGPAAMRNTPQYQQPPLQQHQPIPNSVYGGNGPMFNPQQLQQQQQQLQQSQPQQQQLQQSQPQQQPFHQQFPQHQRQAPPVQHQQPPQQYNHGYNQYQTEMNGMDVINGTMNGMDGNYYHHGGNGQYMPNGPGPNGMMGMDGMGGMNGMNGMGGGMNGMGGNGMGMPMNGMNNMGNGYMNPGMNPGMNSGMNPMGNRGMGMGMGPNMGMNGMGRPMGPGGGPRPMGPNGSNQIMNPFVMQQYQQQQQEAARVAKFGYFPNQQKTVFSEPFPSEEDSPYMRKPVNPHRHQRPKRIRPSDFKSLGE